MSKKILALSGIRSDYDLMSGLYMSLAKEDGLEVKLLLSGAHLSPTFGMTCAAVERDGLDVLLKAETLLDADSKQSRLKICKYLIV